MFVRSRIKNNDNTKTFSGARKRATASRTNNPFNDIFFLHSTLGNQAVRRLIASSRRLQTKLTVGKPNDIYEQEADRVADQVMKMPDSSESIQRMCTECEDELQEKPIDGVLAKGEPGQANVVSQDLESQIKSGEGSGNGLSDSALNFFEPRFRSDFGGVRIHNDSKSDSLNRSLNSRAFTLGNEIYFRQGEYNPTSFAGKKLLAHELTHVVQQNGNKNDSISSRVSKRSAAIQRLTRRSRVNCPAGQNPFSADRRASRLLDRAFNLIHSAQAYRQILPNDADVLAVSNALRRAFRLNPNNARTWDHFVPIIKRRIEIAKDYIDSVVFQFDCIGTGASFTIPGCAAGTCNAGTEAFTCPGNPTDMVLCPLFWNPTRSLNQRGRIIAHEVFHINFGFINDWGQPDIANAHCYAQFVALLNGFNSPAGFRCH